MLCDSSSDSVGAGGPERAATLPAEGPLFQFDGAPIALFHGGAPPGASVRGLSRSE